MTSRLSSPRRPVVPPRFARGVLAAAMTLAAGGGAAPLAAAPHPAVYGDDDRVEATDAGVPAAVRAAAASVAVITTDEFATWRPESGTWELDPTTLARREDLCPDERFADQPSPGLCTGFLVGDDTLVTAGHCVRDESDCRQAVIAFGFLASDPRPTARPAHDVHRCAAVLRRALDPATGADYALIRLDRASDRPPLAVKAFAPPPPEGYGILGHPSGIPLKYAGQAVLRPVDEASPFVTVEADAFAGSSGSPLLDPRDGAAVGILVRGEKDYVWRESCMVPKTCAHGACRGEDAQRLDRVPGLLP